MVMCNSSRKKYLAKNTALFALNTIGTRVIVFFLVPIYTNALSTTEYGIADLITTIVTIASPIITVNIGEAVMRFALDDDADYNEITNIGFVVALMSVLVGLLIIPITKVFQNISAYRMLVYHYCISMGIQQIANFNLRGREKLLQFAISNLINTFLAVALNIIFLLIFDMGIRGYFLSYIFANYVSALYAIVVGGVIEAIKEFKINLVLLKKMIVYSAVLVPNSFMWWIMNSSDRIMVTALVGSAANGVYGVSYKIPTVLSTFATVFNQAWNYSAIHENDSSDIEDYTNRMFSQLFAFLSLVTGMLMLIIKPLLKVYVAKEYYEAWKYTPYLLMGFFFMSLGTFLSSQYTVNKDSKGFLLSGTIGAVVNLVLNAIFIPVISVSGAALATCISYLCVLIYRRIDTRKYIKIKVINNRTVVTTLLLIIIGISTFYNTIIGIIAYFVVVYIHRTTIRNIVDYFMSKVFKRK